MGWYHGFKPYVSVAKRHAQAVAFAAKLAKKEKRQLVPIHIEGRTISRSFWGQAWCTHLESYSDFDNRLPRGRTYVRNGSVIDLQIAKGKVQAIVSGSEIYRVAIDIKTLGRPQWTKIKRDCARSIFSLIDLLQGRFDKAIMQRLCQPDGGLFPQPCEIEMNCSCPDWAGMCKHIAAVLYGVGARLDAAPELLFTLRNVDHLELISQATAADNLDSSLGVTGGDALAASDLGEMFGIELEHSASPEPKPRKRRRATIKSPRPMVADASRMDADAGGMKAALPAARRIPASKRRQLTKAK